MPKKSLRILCWNINGIRAAYKKGFVDAIRNSKADIFCLQEMKVHEKELIPEDEIFEQADAGHSFASKKGYSGVSTYIRNTSPLQAASWKVELGDSDIDDEGRVVVSDLGPYLLYNIYFPSGTTGDVRQDFKYEFLDKIIEHIKKLQKKNRERLILCGDFNICHTEIDIHHPKEATKRELSGFLPDERAWMDSLTEVGFVDAYRAFHPKKTEVYTWWSYRAGARKKNLGWRIDYFFVSEALQRKIKKTEILSEIPGSDHCPITLDLAI